MTILRCFVLQCGNFLYLAKIVWFPQLPPIVCHITCMFTPNERLFPGNAHQNHPNIFPKWGARVCPSMPCWHGRPTLWPGLFLPPFEGGGAFPGGGSPTLHQAGSKQTSPREPPLPIDPYDLTSRLHKGDCAPLLQWLSTKDLHVANAEVASIQALAQPLLVGCPANPVQCPRLRGASYLSTTLFFYAPLKPLYMTPVKHWGQRSSDVIAWDLRLLSSRAQFSNFSKTVMLKCCFDNPWQGGAQQ